MKRAAKRVVLETIGWILVLVGIAALVLPGPGLLTIFAGMALLATQYEWAERRVEPVRKAALRAATESVRTWPRIAMSCLGVAWLVGLGVVWGIRPPVPDWWPFEARWWFPGGWATGSTLLGSAALAAALILYSYRHFREIEQEREEERAEHVSAGD